MGVNGSLPHRQLRNNINAAMGHTEAITAA